MLQSIMFPRERSNIGCTLHMGNPCSTVSGQLAASHGMYEAARRGPPAISPYRWPHVSRQITPVVTPHAPARLRHLVEPRLDRACDANDCISMAMVSCHLQPLDIGTGLDLRIVRAFSPLFFYGKPVKKMVSTSTK